MVGKKIWKLGDEEEEVIWMGNYDDGTWEKNSRGLYFSVVDQKFKIEIRKIWNEGTGIDLK